MKCRRYIISFIFFTIAFQFPVIAQSEYRLAFTQKNGPLEGLSSYNASKVIQDRYGFMWIATQDGLNRFDGRQFIIYNKTSKPEHRLLGNVINEMKIDTLSDLIWVTTSYGGLNGIDLLTGQVIHTLNSTISPNGFRNEWLKCFTFCKGMIWIGTYNGIVVYDPATKSFIRVTKPPFALTGNENNLNASFAYTDDYENVWLFFPDYGMAVYDGASRRLLHSYSVSDLGFNEQKSYLQFPGRIARLKEGSFIMAVNNDFYVIGYDNNGAIRSEQPLPVNNAVTEDYVYAFAIDRDNQLWFSTGDKLFVAGINSSVCRPVKDISGTRAVNDWMNFISYIFFDSGNNIWLACQQGIAFANVREPAFTPFYESPDRLTQLEHVNYVYTDNDTVLYACTTEGLYTVDKLSGRIINTGPGAACNYIFKYQDKYLFVSSVKGLFCYQGGKFLPVDRLFPELKPVQKEIVNSCIALGDSLLVMGTETNHGLFVWDLRTHQLRKKEKVVEQFSNMIVNTLYLDSRDRIWILSDNTIGIWDLRRGSVNRITVTDPDLKIPLSIILDICEAKGSYWLAVYGKGIVQLDTGMHIVNTYAATEGLTNMGVYKILPYKDSLLYITSNNGLFTFNISTRKVFHYLREDGLNTSQFEENCGFSRNGILYVGGVKGFSRVSPLLLKNDNSPPEIFITGVKTEKTDQVRDSFNLHLSNFKITNDVLQTTVSFAAFNYNNPERTTYAYKIRELTDDWIESGSRNFITFIGLKPGKYTLEVRAANEDGVWGKPGQITLEFLPKWYQTLIFRILLTLLLLGIGYSLYRYRILQLRKQQQIRKDIANDLHDDIGSTLNSVKIFTHLAKREPQSSDHLNNIEQCITEASLGLRDMIWVLDDSQDTVYEVMERIRKFAQPVCLADQIKFTSSIDPDSSYYSLTKTEKRNFLLMAKECITNCLKYSKCTHIQISFTQVNNKLSMQIKDDGCGFDTSVASQGNGLKNLTHRAGQIHAICEIVSDKTRGTTVTISQR